MTAQIINLVIAIGVLWFGVYALARALGCHKWYMKATTTIFLKPLAGEYRKNKKLLLGIIAGIIITIALMSSP